MSETKKKEESKEKKGKLVEIKPLKDHLIVQNNYKYDLKKGEASLVAEHFIPALKTEKVIK